MLKVLSGKENSVGDISPQNLKEVPGGGGGFSWINIIKALINGHNFFRRCKNGEKLQIYKVNIRGKRVMLCSYEAMKYLYTNYVHKDLGFGSLRYNLKIMDEYIPLIFQSNDELHHKRRKIFGELAKVAFCKESFYRDAFELIEERFSEGNENQKMLDDFEEWIAEVLSNILSEIILGVRIDYQALKVWFNGCVGRNLSKVEQKVYDVSIELQKFVVQSPTLNAIMKNLEGSGSDLTETEVAAELLFSLIFNGWAAMKEILVSQLINLQKLNDHEKTSLQNTCKQFVKGGFKKHDFDKMTNIESFVLETYRMYPPASFVFGIANDDFVISLSTGKFLVKKDDVLAASVYLVNRDPEKFENPDEFDAKRFVRCPELSSFVTSFGISSTPLEEVNEKETACAGKMVAMTLSKLFFCHFLHAEVKFLSTPHWSGTKIKRFIASDNPVKLSHVKFKRVCKDD